MESSNNVYVTIVARSTFAAAEYITINGFETCSFNVEIASIKVAIFASSNP